MKAIIKALDWSNKSIFTRYYERDMDFTCLIKRKNYILRKKGFNILRVKKLCF